MKKILTILIIAVVMIGLTKNLIAKMIVSGGIKAVTGLTLKMDALDVGLLKSTVRIQGMRLYNPKGFPEPVMINMPEIFVDYDLGALLGGNVHLEELRINLESFHVVRAADGKLNLDVFKEIAGTEGKEKSASKRKKPAPKIQVDALSLKVGKVIYTDYTTDPPKVQEFNVNLDERHENISNIQVLTGLIVTRTLMKTTIARLTGFDLGAIQTNLDAQMTRVKNLATTGVTQATQAARVAAEGAKETFGSATESLKEAGSSLRNLMPFGK